MELIFILIIIKLYVSLFVVSRATLRSFLDRFLLLLVILFFLSETFFVCFWGPFEVFPDLFLSMFPLIIITDVYITLHFIYVKRCSIKNRLLRSLRFLLLVVTAAMFLGGLCGSIWVDSHFYRPGFMGALFSLLSFFTVTVTPKNVEYYIITPWSLEKWCNDTFVSSSTLLPYTLIGPLSLLSVVLSISGILAPFNKRIQLILGLFNTVLITFILGLLLYLTFLQDNPYLPAGVSGSYNFHRHFFLSLALFSNLLAIFFIGRQTKSACSADKMR